MRGDDGNVPNTRDSEKEACLSASSASALPLLGGGGCADVGWPGCVLCGRTVGGQAPAGARGGTWPSSWPSSFSQN